MQGSGYDIKQEQSWNGTGLFKIRQQGPQLAVLPGHQLPADAPGQLQRCVTWPAGEAWRACDGGMAQAMPARGHYWQGNLHQRMMQLSIRGN